MNRQGVFKMSDGRVNLSKGALVANVQGQVPFKTEDGKVNLRKGALATTDVTVALPTNVMQASPKQSLRNRLGKVAKFLTSDKVVKKFVAVLVITSITGAIWAEVASGFPVSTGVYHGLSTFFEVMTRTDSIEVGNVVIVSNKYTQLEYRGLKRVTASYFELQSINADGTTSSYITSVAFDAYNKVDVGEKFIDGVNGEMQPYVKEG